MFHTYIKPTHPSCLITSLYPSHPFSPHLATPFSCCCNHHTLQPMLLSCNTKSTMQWARTPKGAVRLRRTECRAVQPQHTQVHPPCIAGNRTALHPACLAHPAGHRACAVSQWWGQRLDRHALSPAPSHPYILQKYICFMPKQYPCKQQAFIQSWRIIEDASSPSNSSSSPGFLGRMCASWCVF